MIVERVRTADATTIRGEKTVIKHSIEVECSAEDVFAYLDDLERHREWQPQIVSTTVETEGPVRVGTRVHETRRIGSREMDTSYEITAHEPPHRSSFRGIAGPVRPVGTMTVEPIDGGAKSRVSIEFDLVGHGIGRLFAPMARKQARATVEQNQQSLKAKLETGS